MSEHLGSSTYEHVPVSPIEGGPTAEADASPPTSGARKLPGEGKTLLGTSAKSPSSRGFKDIWAWELLSILASFSCLGAITAVLAVVDRKALAWWEFPIRPNAMIAVFSAVAKATFLLPITESIGQLKWLHFFRGPRPLIDLQRFDDASRGPWGSFLFLWRLTVTPTAMLASLGCIITISALAVDPFIQQIISYPSRPATLNVSASTPVATAYDNGNFTKTGTFDPEFTDDQMQGSIVAGAFNLPDQTASLLSCPAGNCTWPVYETLGVCGRCRNVTAESSRSCTDETVGYHVSPRTCNYTTPANNTLGATTGPAGSATYFYTMLNSTAGAAEPRSMSEADITVVDLLRVQPRTDIGVGLPDDADVHECALQWCIRTYGPTTDASAEPVPRLAGWEPLLWDSFRGEDPFSYYDLVSGKDGGRKYSMNVVDMVGAEQMLQTLFTTSTASQDARVKVDDGFSIGNALYKSSNLSTTFDSIATSMTNRLRVGRNVTQVSGEVWGNETYIHVDWPWFALPLALLFLAALLLQASILFNRREKGLLWKSSVTPYLFYHLDSGAVDAHALNGKVSQMEDIAGRTHASLERESDSADVLLMPYPTRPSSERVPGRGWWK